MGKKSSREESEYKYFCSVVDDLSDFIDEEEVYVG